MSFALTLLYLSGRPTQASPVPVILAEQCTLPSQFYNRSTLGIVWSCLATFISCVWVSIHPNVPGPNEGTFTIAFRRVKICFLALVAPELVTTWAIRQRLVAHNVAKIYKSESDRGSEWTLTHGFLTSMGGFMLYKGSQPFRPLTPEELYHLVDNRVISLPSITKKEILDKSKGDSLSKLLVTVQLGWFTLQCFARAAQSLVITELELVTLAFSILSLVTYVMWWDKPLLVECGIPIPFPVDYEEAERREPVDEDVLGCRRAFALLLKVLTPVESAIRTASRPRQPPANEEGILVKIKYLASGAVRNVLLPIGWLVINCFSMGWSERVQGAASHHRLRVSTFYSGKTKYTDGPLCGVAATTIAVIFGGIHCVAWSFAFPSEVERVLWRTSSVVIIFVPVLYLVVFSALSLCFWLGVTGLPGWLENLLVKVFSFYLFSTASLYSVARISLLFQPFLALRSLPPGAYQAVRWTDFVPHL